jgi:hypothetical protein
LPLLFRSFDLFERFNLVPQGMIENKINQFPGLRQLDVTYSGLWQQISRARIIAERLF